MNNDNKDEAADRALKASNAADVPPTGHGEHVLVVDDDATVLRLTIDVLSANHFVVTAAKDGVEALKYFRNHAGEIDVIMTDLRMPEMSGETLIRTIRLLSPTVKIIAISGLDLAPDLDQNAFQGQLRKPYTVDELLRTLSNVLTG